LSDGEWFGAGCGFGGWKTEQAVDLSYEVADTKLARENESDDNPATVAVLGFAGQTQGTLPEFLWVVPPGEGYAGEKYPVLEYAAYYRHVRKRLLKAVGDDAGKETYPEPVQHCTCAAGFGSAISGGGRTIICRCCGIRRQQRDQFEKWNAETMAKLAALPIPLRERPKHGSKAGSRVQKQARVQVKADRKETEA